MSYILDALKRADAERERGSVPGLHSQPLANPVLATAPGVNTRLWLALAGMVVVGSLAVGTWVWRIPASEVKLAAALPSAPAATPVATLPVVAVASVPALPVPVTSAVAKAALAPPLPAPVAPTLARPKKMADSGVKPAASATEAPVSIPLLSELPEEVRRQLPALVITGAVYSEIPANRLLLLNNLVLSQGSQAAPEVSLEEIRPKSSVFNFKGTRFRMTH